jgi:hypothetical protein
MKHKGNITQMCLFDDLDKEGAYTLDFCESFINPNDKAFHQRKDFCITDIDLSEKLKLELHIDFDVIDRKRF